VTLAGQQVLVNIGGVTQTFTLGANGSAHNGRDSFKLSTKLKRGPSTGSEASFRLTLHGAFAATLKANNPLDANGLPTTISIQIQAFGSYLGVNPTTKFAPKGPAQYAKTSAL
jgi:hypothetical protein